MREEQPNNKPVFDRSIWITVALTAVMGLFVLGYKLLTYSDCTGADFTFDRDQLIAGHIVSFKDQSPQAAGREWAFGDGSPPAAGEEVLHVFKHPGEYRVTLQVDGGCSVRKQVVVRKREPAVPSSRYPDFSMPPTARVGEPVRFTDNTAGAKEWQWSFGETMQVDARTKEPTYVFQSSGVKTVMLIVNGKERYAAKKRITVFARPVEEPKFDLDLPERAELKQEKVGDTISIAEVPLAPPLKPVPQNRTPELSRMQLEDYLLQVAEEQRAPETLIPFCCEGFNTRVRADGEEKSLRVLLQDIQGKKVSIENLEVLKQRETGCIDLIKVDYNRKKVLGLF